MGAPSDQPVSRIALLSAIEGVYDRDARFDLGVHIRASIDQELRNREVPLVQRVDEGRLPDGISTVRVLALLQLGTDLLGVPAHDRRVQARQRTLGAAYETNKNEKAQEPFHDAL